MRLRTEAVRGHEVGFLLEARLISSLRALVLEEDGQDLVEYGLLAAFIALAVIASIDAVGVALATTYSSFSEDINAIGP